MKKFICIYAMLLVAVFSAPALFAAEVSNPEAAVQAATVNINTASLSELQTLPGVGQVTAERIIDHRQQHGKFASPEALLEVKGIGEKKLAKIRAMITVE